MSQKLKGSHNSATGHEIRGWLKFISPIVNLFSRCQDKTLQEQYEEGVRIFDIQVRYVDGKWLASHGPVRYDIEPLDELRRIAQVDSTEVYVLLGLDRGCEPHEIERFYKLWADFDKLYPFKLVKVYIDNAKTLYESDSFFKDVHERYWSMAYASGKIDKWWKIWKYVYLIPIPKIWSCYFREEWQKEFDCHEGYIKDFV